MPFTSHRRNVVGFTVAALLLGRIELRAQEPSPPHWDRDLVDLVATIPVQDDGRIKPLLTFADFKLLQFSGQRTLTWNVEEGDRVRTFDRTSVEFLLDCILFPEEAANYPCFLVDHPETLDSIGVARPAALARGFSSYEQLAGGREELSRKVRQLLNDPVKREAWNRSVVEEEVLQLSRKMSEFEGLRDLFEFARHEFLVGDDLNARAIFGGAEKVGLATLFEKMPQVRAELRLLGDKSSPIDAARRSSESAALNQLLRSVVEMSRSSTALCLIPPPGMPGQSLCKEDPWLTVPDVLERLSGGESPDGELGPQIAVVATLTRVWNGRADAKSLRAAIIELHDLVVAAATTRGEYRKVTSEVAFYKADLFSYAIALYVVGSLSVAIGWWLRRDHPWQRCLSRWMLRFMAIPLALNVAGVAWRCWLSGHPPAPTLYDTILLLVTVSVIAAVALERMNRRRIAIGLAALIGAFGLFCAARWEAHDAFVSGTDTLPKLQPVLDANFWISAHVATLTIGYGAGLLAGLLAHVHLFGRLFGLRSGAASFYRPIARMIWGMLCLVLTFTLMGTILGGIWANDAWGRFWGWDPKENGALMVCAFTFALFYARLAGRLNDFALCFGATFSTTIIAFSWWHVSVLGVGLHAYGFQHGIREKLWLFYGVEWVVVAAGLSLWWKEWRRDRRRAKPSPTSSDAAGAGLATA